MSRDLIALHLDAKPPKYWRLSLRTGVDRIQTGRFSSILGLVEMTHAYFHRYANLPA
jgi:hypothetical protein